MPTDCEISPSVRVSCKGLESLIAVPDIVCLQECHCSSDLKCQAWFRASGYLCALPAGSTHAHGCIILFRPTLSLPPSWSE